MTEPPRKRRRRATDTWLPRLLILSTAVNLIALLVLATGTVGLVGNIARVDDVEEAQTSARRAALHAKRTADSLRAEAASRVDATCSLFERLHLDARDRVRRTEDFLGSDLARQNPGLALIARAQIDETRAAARNTRPPPYCRKPGVGLRERR